MGCVKTLPLFRCRCLFSDRSTLVWTTNVRQRSSLLDEPLGLPRQTHLTRPLFRFIRYAVFDRGPPDFEQKINAISPFPFYSFLLSLYHYLCLPLFLIYLCLPLSLSVYQLFCLSPLFSVCACVCICVICVSCVRVCVFVCVCVCMCVRPRVYLCVGCVYV